MGIYTYVFAKLLWVVKYRTNYGPICEWVYLYLPNYWGLIVKYSTNYGPICEWAFIVAKLLWVVKYITDYGHIREWVSSLPKFRVHLH